MKLKKGKLYKNTSRRGLKIWLWDKSGASGEFAFCVKPNEMFLVVSDLETTVVEDVVFSIQQVLTKDCCKWLFHQENKDFADIIEEVREAQSKI